MNEADDGLHINDRASPVTRGGQGCDKIEQVLGDGDEVRWECGSCRLFAVGVDLDDHRDLTQDGSWWGWAGWKSVTVHQGELGTESRHL